MKKTNVGVDSVGDVIKIMKENLQEETKEFLDN